MIPNRRPRVYDTYDIAKEMRETFAARDVERQERFDFGWPRQMQAVGDSLAVAYGSDKWMDKDSGGRRKMELYKHLAEARNRCLARPGIIYEHDNPRRLWPVIGPKVSLADIPQPRHFAVLGLFEEIALKLHTGGTDDSPKFGSRDDGVVHVRVGHAHLGASKIPWSKVDSKRKDEPFIFVYQKGSGGGVFFMVFGRELDIEKDGIVG